MSKSFSVIRILLFAISFLISLPALSDTESELKRAVIASLKDPDSAKFGKFTLVTPTRACMGVNARNSFGGYTGEQQAYLVKESGTWLVASIDKDLSHELCIQVMSSY